MNDLIKEKTPLAMLTNAELLEELLLTVQSEPRAQKNAAKQSSGMLPWLISLMMIGVRMNLT